MLFFLGDPLRPQQVPHTREVIDEIRDVRLGLGAIEAVLYPDVNLEIRKLQPKTAAPLKLRGLRNFAKTQNPAVKLPRPLFLAARNRDLRVIGAENRCFVVLISGLRSLFAAARSSGAFPIPGRYAPIS